MRATARRSRHAGGGRGKGSSPAMKLLHTTLIPWKGLSATNYLPPFGIGALTDAGFGITGDGKRQKQILWQLIQSHF